MDVTVELKCGRCGKADAKSVPLEEAQRLSDREKQREAALEKLPVILNEELNTDYPDVIVAVRTSNGPYTVKSLDNLCASPDAKRNKGCATRVQTLLEDMFMESPKPKKTPKATLEATPEDKPEAKTKPKDKTPKK